MKTTTDYSPDLSRYIAKVQDIPRLSREEEHDLAVRARAGDEAAATRLIEANLRYVVAIALKYRRYGLRMADLVSEGNVGLMTALHKFDPERGTRFVTYAAHWIRALILEHVIRGWSLVGVGSGPLRSKVFFRLRREKAKLLATTGDATLANELLAEKFGTTPERIVVLGQRLETRDLSIDTPGHGEDARPYVETMASSDPSQEELLAAAENKADVDERVREAIGELDPRERYIVEARLMADPPDELSLAEIGRRLGVSRERARQLEARAKAKLKRSLRPAAIEISFQPKAA